MPEAPVVRPFAGLDRGLRESLPGQLRWSAHDYVPGLSSRADRELAVEQWLRSIPEEHDLRFVHAAPSGEEVATLAEVLPWDTNHFGFRIARLHGVAPLAATPMSDAAVGAAVEALVDRARRRGVGYLFAQVDARDLSMLRALGEARFTTIEVRLHHHRSLRDLDFERHAIRLARAEDLPSLQRTAREMVNPFDRFHADPLIPPERAGALMAEWVRASMAGFADAVYVPDAEVPEAFCTTKLHRETWDRWGVRLVQPVVLGAVGPAFKGWYRKMIGEICCRLREEHGAEHAFFVTQAANGGAVRSIERLGFQLGRAELVLRIGL